MPDLAALPLVAACPLQHKRKPEGSAEAEEAQRQRTEESKVEEAEVGRVDQGRASLLERLAKGAAAQGRPRCLRQSLPSLPGVAADALAAAQLARPSLPRLMLPFSFAVVSMAPQHGHCCALLLKPAYMLT